MIAKINHQSLAGADRLRFGQGDRGRPSPFDALGHFHQPLLQRGQRIGSQCQDAAQGAAADRGGGADDRSGRLRRCDDGLRCRARLAEHPRHMFFQDEVEIRAAEAIGADAAAAGCAVATRPLLCFVVEEEGGVFEINVRVGHVGVEGGG